MKKPELLLPAGNVEAFYAAAEGGADAVYLGLRQFNARERARNFTFGQYRAILKEAKQKNIKVYLTLNTLIKNSELPDLLDVLQTISKDAPDAVIIQDLGVLHLIREYFSSLEIHASTQMGIHNSLGVRYSKRAGISRTILARELSMEELKRISSNKELDIELFIHGALCYSFSGMCLFSSFLGGHSANRGNCRQPCRRIYEYGSESGYEFNLKDNQQADNIRKFMKMGVTSLKVEGRMKSAEYVYQVARAYRLLIDSPQKAGVAKEILQSDFGREKTDYFMGKDVQASISTLPYTGKYLGDVLADGNPAQINLVHELSTGDRIRILNDSGYDAKSQKVNRIVQNGKDHNSAQGQVTLPDLKGDIVKGSKVFLTGTSGSRKFSSQLQKMESNKISHFSQKRRNQILSHLALSKPPKKEEIFVRINDPGWLRKVFVKEIDHLILNMTISDLQAIDLNSNFWRDNINKLIIQLPRFIPELSIAKWDKLIQKLQRLGISNFMLSHISQKMLFRRKKLRFYTSENVYVLNDAAQKFLHDEKITNWVYPYENDFPNLINGKDRRGIVPIFFYPELFYSRMPVKIPEYRVFLDNSKKYMKHVRSGITIVVPENPVSLLQFHNRLVDKGFRRFLIDFSWHDPSSNFYKRIMKKFADSQPHDPATTFNFKMGLK